MLQNYKKAVASEDAPSEVPEVPKTPLPPRPELEKPSTRKRERQSSGLGPFMKGTGSSSGPSFSAAERPSVRFSDLGGIDGVLQDIRELVEYPLTHPEIYSHLVTRRRDHWLMTKGR